MEQTGKRADRLAEKLTFANKKLERLGAGANGDEEMETELKVLKVDFRVDVGIGKPLKSRVRHHWEEWILQQGTDCAIFKPPSRMTLAVWINQSLSSLDVDLVRNSWRHGDFSFFDDNE